MNDSFWQAAYIIAALCVVLSIKWLNSPVTARRGVRAGEFGMLLAVIGTLLRHEVISYEWIAIAFVAGGGRGAPPGGFFVGCFRRPWGGLFPRLWPAGPPRG